MKIPVLICIVFYFSSATLLLAAEQKKTIQPKQGQSLNRQTLVDPVLRNKIQFARKLVAERNYLGASSFLEVLYEDDQNNQVIINLLKQCYTNLKQYFKLEELIKKQIQSDKSNIGYYLSLAEVIAQQGKGDSAFTYYEKAMSLIEGKNRLRFQLVIQSMLNHNFETKAEQSILNWRKKYSDNTLLGDQMGIIYERKKEYEKALAEYYPMLDDTTRVGNNVEKEIVELLLFEDSAPIAEAYLVKENEKKINSRAVKILSMHYIRTGQLDKSFAFTKLRDSLYEKNGNSLISYMLTCKREKLFDETIKMGEYLLTNYNQPALSNRARFLIADAQTHLGQYAHSKKMYDIVFENTKSAREKADVLYAIAKIHQDNLNQIDSALYYFDSLTTYYKTGMSYMNALVEIPYCYVQLGKLQKAKELFLAFESKRLHVDVKEKVLYQIAQLLFIENNIDSCKTVVSKLLVNFPTGFYVNDALSLLKIIQKGEDNPKALQLYASAMHFEIQKLDDSVLAVYTSIAKDPSKILADFAFYNIVEIHINNQENLKALDVIVQMEESFADSYYFPFALKAKADILLSDNKKADEALEIYRHLLLEFENYPFIQEVREILRSSSEIEKEKNS